MATRVVDLGNVRGPVGPTGATGAKGATGATGPAGPAGPTGAAGAKGATGPAGPQGNPTTVNGKTGASITLTAGDVGAVPRSGGEMSGDLNMYGAAINVTPAGRGGVRMTGFHAISAGVNTANLKLVDYEDNAKPVRLSSIADPVNADEAVNKGYVDSLLSSRGEVVSIDYRVKDASNRQIDSGSILVSMKAWSSYLSVYIDSTIIFGPTNKYFAAIELILPTTYAIVSTSSEVIRAIGLNAAPTGSRMTRLELPCTRVDNKTVSLRYSGSLIDVDAVILSGYLLFYT